MNRSMKQMLSALLVVAMLAAMLVVPGIAADKLVDGIYKLTADTSAVEVKVDETATKTVSATYAVGDDTYAVSADAIYVTAEDATVVEVTYEVSDDAMVITFKGLKAGTTNVIVTVDGTELTANIPVTVSEPAPVYSISLDATSAELKVGESKVVKATVTPADAEVYVVSVDTAVATASVSGTDVTIEAVGKGSTTAVIGVKNSDETAQVAITVTEAVEPTPTPGPDPIAVEGELVEGEYRMSTKGEGKESTVTCADGVIPGLGWNAGASMHSDHGKQGVTGFAVKVPEGKTATLTIYTCCYGTGAPFSLVSGTATVGESEAIAGSEQDKDTKTVITDVTGTAQFALTGSAYVHCVVVELSGGAEVPTEQPGVLEADVVRAALEPGYDPTANMAGGPAEPYTTANGFTIYPKWDGSSAYNALEIRPTTKFTKADPAVWSDGYTPVNAFRMDGGGNKTAEWDDKAAGTTKEFISNVIEFTVDAPATVKVWFLQKSAKGVALYVKDNPVAVVSEMLELDDAGKVVMKEGEAGIVTLNITEAGTYFLGGCNANGEGDKINVAKVELTVESKPPVVEPEVTKDALESAVAAAKAVYQLANDTYVIADDASTVDAGKSCVSQAAMDQLAAAIANAEAVLNNPDATQADVDAAVDALNDAVAAFQAAVKVGTKEDNSGSGGRNPGSGSGTAGTNPGSTVTKTDANGNTSKKVVDRNGNVTITVTNKDGEVIATVEIPATIPALTTKFKDVPDDHWAAKSINDLAALGLVKGVNEAGDVYDMTSSVTRGSMATILYRLAQGKAGTAADFSDVAAEAWYADAVGWAAKAGIIAGKGDGTFAPDASITREQLAVMLYRMAQILGVDTRAEGKVTDFVDGANTSDWAEEAMTWAVGAGILLGNTANELNPTAAASRAETACMVARFVNLLK